MSRYPGHYEIIERLNAEIADYKTAMAGHKLREKQQDAEIARLTEEVERWKRAMTEQSAHC